MRSYSPRATDSRLGPAEPQYGEQFEVAAGTTTGFFNVSQFPGQRKHILRLLGHVGHTQDHGATPIAGDVVSNGCAMTLTLPED